VSGFVVRSHFDSLHFAAPPFFAFLPAVGLVFG